LLASYASEGKGAIGKRIGVGEGLVGQCAMDKQKILLDNLPPEYIRISSGLGSAAPRSVLVLPLIFEGQVRGVLELASLGGVQPDPPDVPRTAHRVHRDRAQHDRGEHADRRAAQAVPVPRPAAPDPSGAAPADERGTPGEGPALGAPEPGSRTQEHGSRAGPA